MKLLSEYVLIEITGSWESSLFILEIVYFRFVMFNTNVLGTVFRLNS